MFVTLLANLSFLVATQNGEKDLWTSSLLSFFRAYSRLSRTVLRWRILGIHRSLTFHKFKWIEKIGEARTYCLPLDSTQNRKIFSFRSLVFAHSFFIEPLDNCQPTRKDHHHSIDQASYAKSSPSLHSLGRFCLAYCHLREFKTQEKGGNQSFPPFHFPFLLNPFLLA